MNDHVNFGSVASEYAKYRDELPGSLFEQIKERSIDFYNKSVVDLGSGSGIFTRALSKQGAIVTGVEPSKELILEAMKQDKRTGLVNKYFESSAEKVSLPSASYDIVTAVRAWHWFDRVKVIEQVKNFLKSRGYLLVIDSIFLPQKSEIAAQTLDVLREFIELKPAGSKADVKERRSGFPVNWFKEWEDSRFQLIDEWQEEYLLTFTLNSWCGKIKSVSWMTNFNDDLKNHVMKRLEDALKHYSEPLVIPHQYSVVILRLSN